MTDMRMRYIYAGIGVLVLAAALAIPALAQRGSDGGVPGMRPGSGMMGFGWNQGASPVTSIETAAARVRDAVAVSGYSDLVVTEVMEFSNHFYVLVKEKSTGIGALELIVERNGFVHLEYGPAMMWNTKYGHMAGIGGRRMMANPSSQPAISLERAQQIAAQFLAQRLPGTAPSEGSAFYGYFTFDVERGGKATGMLSVNAYTGQVWYHNWHRAFVQEKEF